MVSMLNSPSPPLSHLTDAEFILEVQRRYGGIPAEILAEKDLLELLLPSLRADIAMLEAHEHRAGLPVQTPLHAIVGDSDALVSPGEMAPWAAETAGEFEVSILEGGHFYFQPDPRPLLDLLRGHLVQEDTVLRSEARIP